MDATKSIDFNDAFRIEMYQELEKWNNEAGNTARVPTEKEIDLIAAKAFNRKEAEESLTVAQDKINNYLSDIYSILYEYIAEYDFNRLSPSMYELYRMTKRNLRK
jgi:hypothetical protein